MKQSERDGTQKHKQTNKWEKNRSEKQIYVYNIRLCILYMKEESNEKNKQNANINSFWG